MPATVVMRWAGHSDLRMIVRYYNLEDEESRQTMLSLGTGTNSPRFRTNGGTLKDVALAT